MLMLMFIPFILFIPFIFIELEERERFGRKGIMGDADADIDRGIDVDIGMDVDTDASGGVDM